MSSHIIKEEIVRLLEVIEEQTLIIHAYEKYIPQIELDLIMENVRKLYSRFHELNKINAGDSPRVKVSTMEEVKNEEKKVEVIEKTPAAVEPAPMKHAEEKIPTPSIPEPVIEAVAEIPANIIETAPIPPVEASVEPSPHPKAKETKKTGTADLFGASPTIADKYKEDKKYINDSVAGTQKDQSLGARLQKNKVTDLKAAIGINEKFLFINELFKGDMQKYLDAINLLNTQPGLEEAEVILEQLVKQHQWEADSDAFVKFLSLFNRRF